MLQGLDGKDALLPDMSRRFEVLVGFIGPLTRYLAYCAENGNKITTPGYKRWICSRFLENLSGLGCVSIQGVTGEQIQSAFLALRFNRYWERVGPFLRFLYEKGDLKQNYSKLIQHHHSPRPQPTVYSTEEISSIEKSINLATPNGIRNYAITLLMARYGIRACDVASLTFDDVDFDNNRLHFIQQKTGDPWEGGLLSVVKNALQNYIHNVRKNVLGCNNIFITLMPPYAAIDYRHINTMVGEQFKCANIDIAGRRHGSRAFRSTIASNMINDDISTKVVRNILGHSTKHALKHYVRIDIKSMRLCPLPVPEPSGNFARALSGQGADLHA